MTSGSYTRRQCPACGAKGCLTSAMIFVGAPGLDIEPIPLSGMRCSRCKVESAHGLIIRRGRGQPGPEEIQARMQLIQIEIASHLRGIKAKQDEITDLTAIHTALATREAEDKAACVESFDEKWESAPLPTEPGKFFAFTYNDEEPREVDVYRNEHGNLVWDGRNGNPCMLSHNKISWVRQRE